MAKKRRILVVDDDRGTANLVRLYLEKAGYNVDISYDGLDALAKAKEINPDLMVLDIMLPGKSGLDICRELRCESDVPVIMLTAKVLEMDRVDGFEIGADDYVTKPFSPRELVARVQAVLRRSVNDGMEGSTAVITRGKISLDYGRKECQVNGKPIRLTPTEFHLLAALAMEPNRVFSREELIEKAFGVDYDALERTLDVHILHLRRKLKEMDSDCGNYIVTLYGMGYTLKVD
jgi:DNA-binding response OmpR family regulator